jgi:hypothetical protein
MRSNVIWHIVHGMRVAGAAARVASTTMRCGPCAAAAPLSNEQWLARGGWLSETAAARSPLRVIANNLQSHNG